MPALCPFFATSGCAVALLSSHSASHVTVAAARFRNKKCNGLSDVSDGPAPVLFSPEIPKSQTSASRRLNDRVLTGYVHEPPCALCHRCRLPIDYCGCTGRDRCRSNSTGEDIMKTETRMNTETREMHDAELDCVSGGLDIGAGMQTAARVTIGLINAGLNALTSGGVANKRTWL